MIFTLNLCFVREVWWNNGAYDGGLEPWLTHGPGSCHLSVSQVGSQLLALPCPGISNTAQSYLLTTSAQGGNRVMGVGVGVHSASTLRLQQGPGYGMGKIQVQHMHLAASWGGAWQQPSLSWAGSSTVHLVSFPGWACLSLVIWVPSVSQSGDCSLVGKEEMSVGHELG